MPKRSSQKSANANPSSNWLALQKKLSAGSKNINDAMSRKRRKLNHATSSSTLVTSFATSVGSTSASFPRGYTVSKVEEELPDVETREMRNGESIANLRKMVLGQLEYTSAQQAPGKYLALDCEMVGVGTDGEESSLARVSLVNYYGAVQLDEFVRQRERVVDYRTQWSGIRPADMVKAKPFQEIQKKVAELLKDRILVGHAVHNDLKVLLLSHSRHITRDTQQYASKFKVMNTNRPALRNLVKQEVGVTIQGGEHSSVTDARATMAVFRIHRKEWEKGSRPLSVNAEDSSVTSKKRKHSEETDDLEHSTSKEVVNKAESKTFPGGGRKGVSSGLSTVVKRSNKIRSSSPGEKSQWWKSLGGNVGSSKGSMRLKMG
ncbi:hypothetical protein SERLA73DRAFT_190636 [Serpula lacrymans var. lacrymans S7.3]|uniref:RNA exonuclease 4 n=2 Tax=Serpula lacrymans var. lacrymans TaxID=341189 RepID=F8QG31_SERL3|nr:uncharacterized protein SERLADRAFT_463511 [Serpula lacrymans var. lacrymans S7.9]EGN92779.1 hypothetical protein SERLA73DRAFT_190636 [Serpula lacrymans var. lacrymans S7.3]EGO26440.1 hypothetical protein SERLADRAFT_463511 [Serpula lacrymans var. lacrymans S7.9]